MTVQPIRIEGLAEFNRKLREMDKDLPKGLRLAGNEAAKIVVDWAEPRVPSRTGKARRSVRALSTRTASRVAGGGARIPYYGWLEFGGRVGRNRSVEREYVKGGRYLYKGYAENVDRVREILMDALIKVANEAGLEVT